MGKPASSDLWCSAPAYPLDLVTGELAMRCCVARANRHRDDENECGPLGRFFVALSAKAQPIKAEQADATSAAFAQLWLDGELPLPVAPCTAEQLYRAYRHWCDRNRIQWPPEQAAFTASVKQAQPQIRYNAIRLALKTARVWIPTAVVPRQDDIDAFDSAMTRWIQSRA